MRNNNLSLEEITDDLLRQLHNNSFIMEDFLASGIREGILNELNICRQDIHTICISDIATGNKKTITSNAWKGNNNGTTNCYI